jgi:ketosteroid isomerase-like protein
LTTVTDRLKVRRQGEADMDHEKKTEELVRELVDRQEIKSLKFAYCRYADAIDINGMLSVFTDDCLINFRADRSDQRQGKSALREFFEAAQSVVVASSHHLSNMDIVFLGPDTAAMQSYLYSWQRFAGYPDVQDRHRWVRYEDTLVRTADGWRQSSLLYLVAGELDGGDTPRIGELVGRPVWPATATDATEPEGKRR